MAKQKQFFEVSVVSREDVIESFRDKGLLTKRVEMQIKKLTDDDMQYIARKLGESFCECCYWLSLQDISQRVLEEKK
jgi:hypothetical protein